MVWKLIGGIAAGAGYLVGRNVYRRSYQQAAARAGGCVTADDLSHLPAGLQRSALWALSDGGFERTVLTSTHPRTHGDVKLTSFDLETLRERRGEWAFLPVDRPFRIAGVVSAVAAEVDRRLPHILFKRAGRGDELADDSAFERVQNVAKQVRAWVGMKRSYESELPATLPPDAVPGVPEPWRAYTRAPDAVKQLLGDGLAATLERVNRRDLVIELIDNLVLVYPAAQSVSGPDAIADLSALALAIVDGVLAASQHVTRL